MRSFSETLELEAILFIVRRPFGEKKQSWELQRNKFLQTLSGSEFFGSDIGNHLLKRIHLLVKQTGDFPTKNMLMDDPTLDKEDSRVLVKKLGTIEKSVTESFGASDYADTLISRLNAFRVVREAKTLAISISEAINKKVQPNVLSEQIASSINKLAFPIGDEDQLISIGSEAVTEEGKSKSKDFVERMLFSEKPPAIPTGFAAFDAKSYGIFRGGVWIIAATTGGGKSTLALQGAFNQARMGYRVCVVSLEMSQEELFSRLLANVCSIPVNNILNLELTKKSKKAILKKYEAIENDMKEKGGTLDVFSPEGDVTIDDLSLMLSPHSYDIIYVDYISLLGGVDGEDSWRQLGSVARVSKIWAKKQGCVIALLAQLSEEMKVRYSGAIKEHATNVWAWVQNDESRDSNRIKVTQLKARNQPIYSFELMQELEFMRISDPQGVEDIEDDSDEDDSFVDELKPRKRGKYDRE